MKNKIKEKIFSKEFNGDNHPIYFSYFPKDLREDDIIDIQREQAYYSNNNSHDG